MVEIITKGCFPHRSADSKRCTIILQLLFLSFFLSYYGDYRQVGGEFNLRREVVSGLPSLTQSDSPNNDADSTDIRGCKMSQKRPNNST